MKKYHRLFYFVFLPFIMIMMIGCSKHVTDTSGKISPTLAKDNISPTIAMKTLSPTESLDPISPNPMTDTTETDDNIDHSKEALQKQIDSLIKNLHGSILIAKDGDILLAKGYGYANKKDKILNNENTTFEIGSVTKQFTAAAIMQLAEHKKLSVNDTIDQYFPDYPLGNQITIKNLLQMRSGIYDYMNELDHFWQHSKLKFDNEKEALNSLKYINQKSLLENLYKLDLAFKPDSSFSYSNTNYVLLSIIIKQVSGMSYQDYIQKNIFDVCDMKSNMKFQDTDAIRLDPKYGQISFPYSDGCGNINASVMDLYKWNEALFHGKIVSDESLKEMKTPVGDYGYGFVINKVTGTIWHNGGTLCFYAYNSYNINDHVQLIYLTNYPDEHKAWLKLLPNIKSVISDSHHNK